MFWLSDCKNSVIFQTHSCLESWIHQLQLYHTNTLRICDHSGHTLQLSESRVDGRRVSGRRGVDIFVTNISVTNTPVTNISVTNTSVTLTTALTPPLTTFPAAHA
jgi:hypothetical protein